MNDLKTPRAGTLVGAPPANADNAAAAARRGSAGGLPSGANRSLATASMPVGMAQRTSVSEAMIATTTTTGPAAAVDDFDAQLAQLEAAAGPLPSVSHSFRGRHWHVCMSFVYFVRVMPNG